MIIDEIKPTLFWIFTIIVLWGFIFSFIVVLECEHGGHIIIINSFTDSNVNIIDWELIKRSALISSVPIIAVLMTKWILTKI